MAAPTSTTDIRFIRNAGLPSGWNTIENSQPSTTNAGNPVGCIVPSVGSTTWASPVSQAPSVGSIVVRMTAAAAIPVRAAARAVHG